MSALGKMYRFAAAMVFVLAFSAGSALAADYTAMQAGDWDATSTWGGAGYPASGDTATINGAYNVKIDGTGLYMTNLDEAIDSLGLSNGHLEIISPDPHAYGGFGTFYSTLTINSAATLSGGTVTLNARGIPYPKDVANEVGFVGARLSGAGAINNSGALINAYSCGWLPSTPEITAPYVQTGGELRVNGAYASGYLSMTNATFSGGTVTIDSTYTNDTDWDLYDPNVGIQQDNDPERLAVSGVLTVNSGVTWNINSHQTDRDTQDPTEAPGSPQTRRGFIDLADGSTLNVGTGGVIEADIRLEGRQSTHTIIHNGDFVVQGLMAQCSSTGGGAGMTTVNESFGVNGTLLFWNNSSYATGNSDMTVNGGAAVTVNSGGELLAMDYDTDINADVVNNGSLRVRTPGGSGGFFDLADARHATGSGLLRINGDLTSTSTVTIEQGHNNGTNNQLILTGTGNQNDGTIQLGIDGGDRRYTDDFSDPNGQGPLGTSTLDIPSGGILVNNGTIKGNGTIVLSGTLDNSSGVIAPGLSAGLLNVQGDLPMSGTLAIELGGLLAGDEHDQLAVSGTAILDGLLDVELIDGFADTITAADSFTILTGSSVSGYFSNAVPTGGVGTLALADGYTMDVVYNPDSVVLANYVPEPATLTLLALGGLAVVRWRKK